MRLSKRIKQDSLYYSIIMNQGAGFQMKSGSFFSLLELNSFFSPKAGKKQKNREKIFKKVFQ